MKRFFITVVAIAAILLLAGCPNDSISTNYAVTVSPSGAASGESVIANLSEAFEGTTIILTAALNSGRQVTLSTPGVTITPSIISSSGATASFTMPAQAVEVTATFSNIPSTNYEVTVSPSGAASGEEISADVPEAPEGETVTLTAALNTGRQVALSAAGVTITPSTISSTGGTASFTMPAEAVEVEAAFSDIPSTDITVTLQAIPGVTAPVYGETPVATITETAQYTGVVSWSPAHATFGAEEVYTATITLTAKSGYTLSGVTTDFFTVAGATTVTNSADSGVVTATFPATEAAPIDDPVIEGVTVPAYGVTPSETISWNNQYTGTITWIPTVVSTFEAATVYTATITLTAKSGYTLSSVTEDFFTVSLATTTNSAGSGVVTAVFPETEAAPLAVDSLTYTADGVSFTMNKAPGGLTFPTGTDDSGTATVESAYWVGETEVTYELWEKVYSWATGGSGDTGAGQYTFTSAGAMGGGSGDKTNQHPVTNVSWRDSIVWCNALTEWYNALKTLSVGCVYTYSSEIIRDSGNITACDNAVASSTAKGFRLLTSDEYELSARYRGTTGTKNIVTGTINSVDFDAMETKWTKGNSASADIQSFDADQLTVGNYAVYNGNSGRSSAEVKSKIANALGLYDMSGNVKEWCFNKWSEQHRSVHFGNWDDGTASLQIGYRGAHYPNVNFYELGFRFARTE